MNRKKLALVYDWIDSWGGAERILITLFDAFPDADIYTLFVDYKKASWAIPYRSRIHTTFLDKLYKFIPNKKLLTPLMPAAIESFDLSLYDTVLSITSSFAKGVITRPETKHISYVFTPTRFLWHEKKHYKGPRLFQFFGSRLKKWLQAWDTIASKRPDKILTLSKHTQNLLAETYQLPSTVLYPPFNISYYGNLKKNSKEPSISLPAEYFLFVGRLEPYKHVDLLVEAFAQMPNEHLVIVGTGSERKKIRRLANKHHNVLSVDRYPLTDCELAYVYQQAAALLMPQSEDFGYTALESLYFGTPVISYAKSGAAEIIQTEQNGVLVSEQTVRNFRREVENFKRVDYNVDTRVAVRFNASLFLDQIKKELEH